MGFSLNKKVVKTTKETRPQPKANLHFQIVFSKNGTRSVFCSYFDGYRNFQEYFNFKKNGKLTQGSIIDYKRLCDCFNLEKKLRYEILAMNNCDSVDLDDVEKVQVLVDSAGFMKWFDKEGFRVNETKVQLKSNKVL